MSATDRPRMVLVAAVAQNGVISLDGAIPWDLSEDRRHFRRTTTGHAIVMGRTTYEEMGALPNRTSIVLTRDPAFTADDAIVVHSLDDALAAASEAHPELPAMIVGGAQIYALAIEHGAELQIISEVHEEPEGDTWYPEFDRDEWSEARREPHDGFEIVWWERRRTECV